MSKEIEKIDIEPTWNNLILVWYKEGYITSDILSEITKMANISDIVRQAQKENKILKLYPNGKFEKI